MLPTPLSQLQQLQQLQLYNGVQISPVHRGNAFTYSGQIVPLVFHQGRHPVYYLTRQSPIQNRLLALNKKWLEQARATTPVHKEGYQYKPRPPKGMRNPEYALEHEHIDGVMSGMKNKKIGVNDRNSKGNTPLHIAVKKCHFGYAKELLKKYGANPTIKNNEGKIALALLVEKSDLRGTGSKLKRLLEKSS